MPKTPPKPKTREELEKEWWDRWWAEDYSWRNLSQKGFSSFGGPGGSLSLAQYWSLDHESGRVRTTEELKAVGELVPDPVSGDLFHIAHVPTKWKDGRAAKSAWNDAQRSLLNKIILQRLRVGSATEVDRLGLSIGRDERAQFSGVVFLNSPTNDTPYLFPVHMVAEWAWIPNWRPMRRVFASGASFSNAMFVGDTAFSGVEFIGPSHFAGAIFSGAASFFDAKFLKYTDLSSVHFAYGAQFVSAGFGANVIFSSSVFQRDTYFVSSVFEGNADFSTTTFLDEANFSGVEFRGAARFPYSEYFGQVTFKNGRFDDFSSFENVRWPESLSDKDTAFEAAVFGDIAIFGGQEVPCFSSFRNAYLGRGAILSDVSLQDLQDGFDSEFAEIDLSDESYRLQRFSRLEDGCLALKRAASSILNKKQEHLFSKFELLAARKRLSPTAAEWWVSLCYDAVSDCGSSIARPIVCLIYLWASMALVYLGIGALFGGGSLASLQSLWDAFDLSLSRVFQPLTFWSDANLKDNALGMELVGNKDRGLLALSVRLIGTLQSLISIILLFLSGLAIRRRFQIN